MATATARKPAAIKPTVKPPTKPAAGKAPVKPAAAAKPPKPVKEIAPFEAGTIVVFKGYAKEPPADTVKLAEGTELAVVGQRTENDVIFVACVAPGDYHRYMANPDDPNGPEGNEYSPNEIKRTPRKVEEPFALVAIGEYDTLVSETPDPLDRAHALYNEASKAFFYMGATLAELWHGKAEDETTPLFSTYQRDTNAPAPDDATALEENGGYSTNSQGFALFVDEQFPGFGGIRKAKALIAIYQTYSALPNAAEVVTNLARVGWFKADMIRNYITDENVNEVVEAAETMSVETLRSHLKTSYVTEEGTTTAGKQTTRVVIKKTSYTFQLFEDQATGVNMIIDAAKKQTGLTDDNALFEHVFSEWAGTHLGPDAVAKAQAATKKRTEALVKSGVKLPESHPDYVAPEPKGAPAAETPAAPAPKRVPPRKVAA